MSLDLFSPWGFVLLVLASFRLVRFFVFDSLIGSHLESGTKWSRRLDGWAFTANGADKNFVVAKVATGLTCPWCVSPYASVGVVALASWSAPWSFGAQLWALTLAVAGASAVLSVASRKWLET